MNAEANGSNWISVSATTTTPPDLRVVGVNFALCRVDDSLSTNAVGLDTENVRLSPTAKVVKT